MDKVFVGSRVSDLDTGGGARHISRVILRVDGETQYTAGDDAGQTLEKSCPWGTQEMCESILRQVRGVEYRPFSGVDGLLDPAAETGDGITVGSVYSVLARTDITFDALCAADIAAPGVDEVEDEYPYKSRAQREAERQIAQTYSRITKTAEQIRLEVANDLQGLSSSITVELTKITQKVEDTAKGLRAEFTVSLNGISSRVSDAEGNISTLEQTAKSLTTKITNAEGDISSLEQTAKSLSAKITNAQGDISSLEQFADSLTLSVSNGETSSTIRLRANGVELASREIYFRGMVSFEDLAGNRTIINGSTIDTETLFLDSLYGDHIYLRDSDGEIAVEFRVTGASTARNACDIWARSMRLNTLPGDIYINAGDGMGGEVILEGDGISCGADIFPQGTGYYSCGTSLFRWSDVYADNDTIVTSDWEKKEAVAYGLDRYAALFDALRPVSFRLRKGQSGRTHLGLIAQDVEAAMEAAGLTGMDFAGLIKSPRRDEAGKEVEGAYDYALRYGEFTALCIAEIQGLKGRVTKLEGSILV